MTDPSDPQDPLEGLDVEPGLAAAFEGRADEGAEGQSVLARLSQDGRRLVPLLLRDPEDGGDLTPVVKPGPGDVPVRQSGRYQVLGEIARGGVGIVLKGHDVDLGRHVAMKVMRSDHRDNPDLVQRFVEEAQIGGQLQHPGIVPVYEIGVGEDESPFFTMKLVKGQTLAESLADRRTPAEDRQRLLTIFESVCQTMAYAHARGVIHRDLKPSNVMLGSFGEVLVVDWGLGKVLRSGGIEDERRARSASDRTIVATQRSESDGSQSVVGSVMGTPRYMPPEQARGDLDRVDKRSDVFGLGAILCEILTGKPPYVGEKSEVFTQAATARLDDAYARLEACGADADLVEIARRCLAPAPEARPANAGELAAMVARYRSDIDERIAASRLAAVRAEERAGAEEAKAEAAEALMREERKAADQARRARRLTLALASAVLLFTLAGGAFWMHRQDERARAEALAAERVSRALERASLFAEQAEASQDLALWERALAAADEARQLATTGEPTADLASRVQAAWQDIAPRAARAEEVRAEMARARQLVLDGDQEEALAAYRAVTERMPRLAEAYRRMGDIYRSQGRVAEAVDAYRESIAARPTPQAWYGLVRQLHGTGDQASRMAAARQAVAKFPESADLHNLLGNTLPQDDLPGRIAAYRDALRVDPGAGPPAFNLTRLYEAAVESGDARVLDGELLPPDGRWRLTLAHICQGAGRRLDAVRFYELAFAVSPQIEESTLHGNNHRIHAAWVALAAVQHEDLEDRLKASLRTKALGWLSAHMAAWSARLDEADAEGVLDVARSVGRHAPAVQTWVGQTDAYGFSEAQRGALTEVAASFSRLWERTLARLSELPDVESVATGLEPVLVIGLAEGMLQMDRPEEALAHFEAAFERDARLRGVWRYTYNAACAALRVAAATSSDPTRAGSLRRKALVWLEESLAASAPALQDGDAALARQALAWWREDPDLAGVRAEGLEALPAAERASWEALWGRLDEILR